MRIFLPMLNERMPMHAKSMSLLNCQSQNPFSFWKRWGTVVCALQIALIGACDRVKTIDVDSPPAQTISEQVVVAAFAGTEQLATDALAIENITSFCSGCHAMPIPTSFSREHWPREVQRGFDFYFASGRTDLSPPSVREVEEYFVSRATEALPSHHPKGVDNDALNRYRLKHPNVPQSDEQGIAGANIGFFDWGLPVGSMLMLSDMRDGSIMTCGFNGAGFDDCEVVAKLNNPSRMSQCDLDNNGRQGLLVADLGSFLPADHKLGRVVWLRRQDDRELRFEKVVLLRNCGRVADVRAADLDDDGDLDLCVADFGWHKTGKVLWLERVSDGPVTAESFVPHVLDERSGAVEVNPIDINKDGKLDIVALIAQETESIVAFLNDGNGGFTRQTLYAAMEPSYGSSGMEFCDLDRDGDEDIVYTNGDSFDRYEVKPFHGIHWLENRGNLKFHARDLVSLPGVHRAVPSDVDDDGDLDIVANAFLPGDLSKTFVEAPAMSIILLENDGKQDFKLRPLQVGKTVHPSMCIGDFNDDGIPDIAAANFEEDANQKSAPMDVLLSY